MDWQDKLYKDFSYLYRGRKLSLRHSLMGFGFECGEGWKDILEVLSILIMDEIKKQDKLWKIRPYLITVVGAWNTLMRLQPKWLQNSSTFGNYPRFTVNIFEGFTAVQVKEKYGTLRFYMNYETEVISKYIRLAELLSESTCEKCGASGKIRGTGWMYVACDEHTAAHDLPASNPEDETV